MGLFSKAKNAVKKVAKKVKKAAKAVVNAVEEVVSDVVETVGNGIQDGSNWIGGKLGPLGVVFQWIGAVISSVTDLIAAVIKGVIAIAVGILGGLIQMVLGVFWGIVTWGDWSVLEDGFHIFLSGIVGGVLIILAGIVVVVQTILPFQGFERPLTEKEKDIVRRVFWESIALYNVRLVEGRSGLFSLSDRPFTLGNTIYLKDRDVSKEPELLIHECVHVWQYQNNGASYIGGALGAQAFVPDEYSWEREIARGNSVWVEFNKEAQGKFLENLWCCGSLDVGGVRTNGEGKFYLADGRKKIGYFYFNENDCLNEVFPMPPTGTDYSDLADEAVEEVRGAQSARLSASWS